MFTVSLTQANMDLITRVLNDEVRGAIAASQTIYQHDLVSALGAVQKAKRIESVKKKVELRDSVELKDKGIK